LFHFLFRAIGMIVLALAVVTAVLDLTRSIAVSSFVLTPFAVMWEGLSATSLQNAQLAVETYLHPYIWNPMITTFLQLPSWLILWLLAMLLLWLGQKRQSPYGRFASR